MLNENNIFQNNKMDNKKLSTINNNNRRARQTYEMEHKISAAWIKKLNSKGQAKLSQELQVVSPLGKKPSITIKKRFQNEIEALRRQQFLFKKRSELQQLFLEKRPESQPPLFLTLDTFLDADTHEITKLMCRRNIMLIDPESESQKKFPEISGIWRPESESQREKREEKLEKCWQQWTKMLENI